MDALLTPAFGTVVWSTIAFLVVLFLLRKMAWGPILTALKEREESIATALNEADKARSEMSALQADNERLLQEARAERDGILVNCGQGQLNLQRVQLPGARALTVEEVLNAHRSQFAPGRRFQAAG